jgi:hypothetical protein
MDKAVEHGLNPKARKRDNQVRPRVEFASYLFPVIQSGRPDERRSQSIREVNLEDPTVDCEGT